MTKLLGHPQWKDAGDSKETIDGEPALVTRLEVDNTSTYIDKDGSGNMAFTDAVTGTKTLAQLSAGGSGSVDTSGTPADDDIAVFTDEDTIEGLNEAEFKEHVNLEDSDITTLAKTVKLDDLTAPDDNTDLDASAAKHGLMPKADSSKLAGIETAATADQTGAEIKALYEAEDDTNAFTDNDHSKLDGIEASADKTDETNVNAAGATMNTDSTLAGNSYFLDEDAMGSNDATKVASQQSIKAYADGKITTHEAAADPHTGYRLESATDYITGAHLSQTFGATAGRLYNFISTPISGEILRLQGFYAPSPFSGAIDDNAGAHGGQGLDATHVPYDGDSNENMFQGMSSYDGSDHWGQIILHNTTRSNSRNIVSVDRTNDVITTTSSTDNWADNDVITVQSQTNAQAGYFDVLLDDNIATTDNAAIFFMTFDDTENNWDASRYCMVHPFASYDAGTRAWASATNALEKNTLTFPMSINSQKITMMLGSGCNGATMVISVKARVEYADT